MLRVRYPAKGRAARLYSLVVAWLDPGLLVAGALALFAIAPLLAHAGLPNTADGPAHLMRQAELNQAWQDGILYPRWAPDLAYGYGMPLFHYAPPLLYQLTQLLHLAGPPLDAAMKGTLILMLLLYSGGMYLFARDVFGPRAGLLAAAAYVYAPYRLREAYIQGNYGQFCGLAFYPLILWAFHGLVATGRRRYLPLAALALAGLLLSHNISAMIFAPLLGAYLVFLLALKGLDRGDRRRANSGYAIPYRIAAAIALGLGLSAFFWLPAFGERDLVRLAGITSGFFDFRHNFISLPELVALPRPLDLASINPYYPLSLGLAQISLAGLALLGLIVYAGRRAARRLPAPDGRPEVKTGRRPAWPAAHLGFFAAGLLATSFLALPASRPIWETVPLLELAEFPWRWLGPGGLCAAVVAGGAVYVIEELLAGRRAGGWALGAGLAFILAANLFYLFPAQFIPWGTPGPADAVAYEAESRAIGTTSTGEFLPRWADRYPAPESLGPDYAAGRLPAKLDPASLPAGAAATTLSHTARETRLAVSSPAPFTATFRALYWPGWQARVSDGGAERPVDFQVTRPDGLVRARLPAGEYQVSLRLFATPIRRLATLVSVVSAAALLGVALLPMLTRRRQATSGRMPTFQAAVLGAALIAALAATRPAADWFRLRSPVDQVRGAQHELGVDLGGQVRLLAYDIAGGRPVDRPQGEPAGAAPLPEIHVEAGDVLPVVLYWRALRPLDTNYSVFLHLDAPNGQTYAGADEVNPEDIPSSHWPPSLYVRNLLALELPAGLPAIRYTLAAGLYDSESGRRLPVTGCAGCGSGDAIPLAQVWVAPPLPLRVDDVPQRLDYRLGDDVDLLGYELAEGEPAMLTLYWRAGARLDQSYTVFIHALGPDGAAVAQFDAPPLGGLYPTQAWRPGQIIADAHRLDLPASTRALALGLYDAGSLARLPVTDAGGGRVAEDAVRIQVAE
jgi:hypothetical protein